MPSSKKKTWVLVLVVLRILILVPTVALRILNATLGATPLPPRGDVDPAHLAIDDAVIIEPES